MNCLVYPEKSTVSWRWHQCFSYHINMPSIFDSCTDVCGWIAAPIAALSYGSFGVPIRGTKHVPVHPLMMQSYKTTIMFITCWAVVFLGVDIGFTKWGLLSGFLWVVGGTGGIYGIRMAGLAVAVGTWASIMVMINFLFGIVIFQEPVADVPSTLCSFLLLIVGLVGMSIYSAPPPKAETIVVEQEVATTHNGDPGNVSYQYVEGDFPNSGRINDETEGLRNDNEILFQRPTVPTVDPQLTPHVVLFNGQITLTSRQCGILGAALNGVMTGGSLVPIHYAGEEGFGGARFFPSMACGAMISNFMLWSLYFVVKAILDTMSGKSIRQTVEGMPKLFFRELWFPGLLAGLLLSLAMFTSILAVTYLGQGVGNSLVQTKILVSGLWGIFWYHEIRGAATIAKWFVSAGICIAAIIWLSLERLQAKAGDHNRQLFRQTEISFD
jgi:glucose uptake protein GlcU